MIEVINKKINVKLIPTLPGVYKYYNKKNELIYIGKAKNLRNRIASYFINTFKGVKTEKLVSEIQYIEYIEVSNEFEAFLLESELIKKYQPKYNIDQKDDKSYSYIVIDSFKDKYGNVIKGFNVVKIKNEKYKEYFGPYLNAGEIKQALRLLRRIFPFKNCSKSKYSSYSKNNRKCLFGEIGLCCGPCIDENQIVRNSQSIKQIKQILIKGYNGYLNNLVKKMNKYSNEQKYEEALQLRNQINQFKKVFSNPIMPDQYEMNPNLLEDISKKRMERICQIFNINLRDILRIECYDISNIMGKWSTGSMVVSDNGILNKKEYRKFKIKYTKGITDFGMLSEVLSRRLYSDWKVPDVILIDGGRGQVGTIIRLVNQLILKDSKLSKFKSVLVAGIFKPNDYLLINLENKWKVIRPAKNDEGYKHLIELRDEAHRFAKSYHKKLRNELVTKEN